MLDMGVLALMAGFSSIMALLLVGASLAASWLLRMLLRMVCLASLALPLDTTGACNWAELCMLGLGLLRLGT